MPAGMPNVGPPPTTTAGGYGNALSNLNSALKLSQGSDSSQLMQAQQGLQQNQGKVQQGLINAGLGNTTVAQTMQQAPLQTYNQQVAGIQNNLANQQIGILGQGAGLQAQGGQANQQMQMLMQQLAMQQQDQYNKNAKPAYNGGTGGAGAMTAPAGG